MTDREHVSAVNAAALELTRAIKAATDAGITCEPLVENDVHHFASFGDRRMTSVSQTVVEVRMSRTLRLS